MPDERDSALLRAFAAADAPLAATPFCEQVMAQLQRPPRLLAPGSGSTILNAALSGVGAGLRASLRLRHALMAVAAAALSLWAVAVIT